MSSLFKRDADRLEPPAQDQLLSERTALLREINIIEQNKYRTDGMTSSLCDLRRKYNYIKDSFNKLKEKPRYDPMDKIPSELFRMIIHEASTPSDSRPHDYPYDSNQALVLTLVSTRWRNFILQLPSLWTGIQINSRLPDCLARIALCLALSRDLPIQLNITFPIGIWGSIVPILRKNIHRIHGIAMYYYWPWTSPPTSRQICLVLEMFEQLLPIPNVRNIYTCHMDNRGDVMVRWLLDHFSRLQSVTRLSLRDDMLRNSSVHELRSVYSPVELETFISLQSNMPMLTHVELLGPLSGSLAKRRTLSIPPLHPSNDPLSWRYLSCWYPHPETLFSLIPRLTNLRELALGIQISKLRAFLTHLHRFMQLSRLTLSLDTAKDNPDDPFSIPDAQPNDQVIFLELKNPYNANKDSTTAQDFTSPKPISESLAKIMPGLQEVMLFVPVSLDISTFYEGRGLSKLSKLDLTFNYANQTLDHYYESAPSLRNIRIRSKPDLWPHFSSSNATQVKFNSMGYRVTGGALPKLEHEKWPALRILSTFGRCLVGRNLRLPYLRRLELRREFSPHGEPWRRSEDTTRFCKELSLYPSQLPLLKELILWGTPQWDILLLMLKKRNISASIGASPLKYLTISDCCPQELIYPIVSLLKGQFPSWWSLYDVSIHTALELMCDQSM
jgi:hypothetical protein